MLSSISSEMIISVVKKLSTLKTIKRQLTSVHYTIVLFSMGIIGAFSNKLKVTHIAPLLHDAILGHHSMAIDQVGVLGVIIS